MVQHNDPKVQRAGEQIACHLADIDRLFKPGVKITLIARHPDFPDGSRDMIVLTDTLDQAIRALEIRRAGMEQKS